VTQPYDDDALAARLRAADPASSVPPADPDRVARLLEDTMSNTGEDMDDTGHEDLLTESRETGTRNRSPLTWLVAAAAAVIILGAGIFAVVNGTGGDDSAPPVAGPEPSATVTALTAPDAAAYEARCMVPTAEVLSRAEVAFDGTVESISGGLVTLAPTHWYAGGPTDLVTVEAPSEEIAKLLVAVEFEDGGRYLVAASDSGQVMVCGFSAPYTEGLAATYAEAFGR
jgi:hypothetical protein